jgi:FAD:protein FMN transferase
MSSPSPPIERAKPVLGAIVRIRVSGLARPEAFAAIDGAFRIVEEIHALMSFQSPGGELSRLNREAHRSPVETSAHTRAVLSKALEIADASDGLFDPTVAPSLVRAGLTPAPTAQTPDPASSWRDIVLGESGTVAYRRPLWIDLSGVAKGYAVDCAVAHLQAFGPARICVEAGGDLRLSGPGSERVWLDAPGVCGAQAVLDVEEAAVASSGSQVPHGEGTLLPVSPHIDPRTGMPCRTDRFATVVAPLCVHADALTKVVMIAGPAAAPLLRRYQAQALLCEGGAWTRIADA